MTTKEYGLLCYNGSERAPNFYYRNQALCDSILALIIFALVGAMLFAMAQHGVMAS
jgi:hypothetical protein